MVAIFLLLISFAFDCSLGRSVWMLASTSKFSALVKDENVTSAFYLAYKVDDKLCVSKMNINYNTEKIYTQFVNTNFEVKNAVWVPNCSFVVLIYMTDDALASNTLTLFKFSSPCASNSSGEAARKLWERNYTDLIVPRNRDSVQQGLPYSRARGTLVLGSLDSETNIILHEVDVDTGNIVRNKTYNALVAEGSENERIAFPERHVIGNTNADAYVVYAGVRIFDTYIYIMDGSLKLKAYRILEEFVVASIYEVHGLSTNNSSGCPGIVVLGEFCKSQTKIGDGLMLLSGSDLSTIWINSKSTKNVALTGLVESAPYYVAYANNDAYSRMSIGILEGFSPADGSLRWQMKRNVGTSWFVQTIALGERELVSVEFYSTYLSIVRHVIPPYVEYLKCNNHDLSECRTCPSGNYWNYTECIRCMPGCEICIDSDTCENCWRGFRRVQYKRGDGETRCVREKQKNATISPPECDCRNVSTLTQSCLKNCSLPQCVILPAEPSITVVPQLLTSGQPACVCPEGDFYNGTHCFLATNISCPSLCSHCSKDHNNISYCTACAAGPKVMVHRTSRHFVDCRCEFAHEFNGSVCVHVAASAVPSPKNERDVAGLAAAVLGTLFGTAFLAAVAVCVLRRPRDRAQRVSKEDKIRLEMTRGSGTEGVEMPVI